MALSFSALWRMARWSWKFCWFTKFLISVMEGVRLLAQCHQRAGRTTVSPPGGWTREKEGKGWDNLTFKEEEEEEEEEDWNKLTCTCFRVFEMEWTFPPPHLLRLPRYRPALSARLERWQSQDSLDRREKFDRPLHPLAYYASCLCLQGRSKWTWVFHDDHRKNEGLLEDQRENAKLLLGPQMPSLVITGVGFACSNMIPSQFIHQKRRWVTFFWPPSQDHRFTLMSCLPKRGVWHGPESYLLVAH